MCIYYSDFYLEVRSIYLYKSHSDFKFLTSFGHSMILKAGLTVDLISNKIIEIKFRHTTYYIFESNNVELTNQYNCNVQYGFCL